MTHKLDNTSKEKLMYYALKDERRFVFSCVAQNQKEHEEKVQRAYYQWRGLLPKGNPASLDEFLKGYERVLVTLTRMKL